MLFATTRSCDTKVLRRKSQDHMVCWKNCDIQFELFSQFEWTNTIHPAIDTRQFHLHMKARMGNIPIVAGGRGCRSGWNCRWSGQGSQERRKQERNSQNCASCQDSQLGRDLYLHRLAGSHHGILCQQRRIPTITRTLLKRSDEELISIYLRYLWEMIPRCVNISAPVILVRERDWYLNRQSCHPRSIVQIPPLATERTEVHHD